MKMTLLVELRESHKHEGKTVTFHGRESKAVRYLLMRDLQDSTLWRLYRVHHSKAGDYAPEPRKRSYAQGKCPSEPVFEGCQIVDGAQGGSDTKS